MHQNYSRVEVIFPQLVRQYHESSVYQLDTLPKIESGRLIFSRKGFVLIADVQQPATTPASEDRRHETGLLRLINDVAEGFVPAEDIFASMEGIADKGLMNKTIHYECIAQEEFRVYDCSEPNHPNVLSSLQHFRGVDKAIVVPKYHRIIEVADQYYLGITIEAIAK